MTFSSLFKKKGNYSNPQAPGDTPASEDPQGIPWGSFLHPQAPTGTRFNRKLIMILGAVAGLVAIFAFMSALTPPKKLTPQEQADERAKKGESTVTNNAAVPDAISTAPDTYGQLGKYQEEQQARKMKLAALQAPLGGDPAGTSNVGDVRSTSTGTVNAYNAQGPNSFQAQRITPGPAMMSDEDKQLLDARKSPIKFATTSSSAPASSAHERQGSSGAMLPAITIPPMPWQQKQDDQNLQDEKREFRKDEKKDTKDFYVKAGLMPPLSKYEVKAGAIIPGVMITGINSDLPGRLTGQVRENVYDSVSGRYLLVPQGTKVIGTYDSKVAYAQNRVLIVWTRLIFPNGDSIDLEGMDGVDLSGYAGLKDRVNNHYGKLITGVVLSSLLAATAKVAAGNSDVGTANFAQQATSGAAEQVASVGAKITDKNLNVQPTIEIRPGMKFNVFVNKDLILKPYKNT